MKARSEPEHKRTTYLKWRYDGGDQTYQRGEG